VGVVSYEVYTYVHSVGDIANFTFIDWDPNPWDTIHTGPGYILICTFMVLMFFINTVYAGFRIVKWIYTLRDKFEINIGFSCLVLEWICNLLRVIQSILTPLHNNFRLPFVDILYTLPICLTLITSILIVFFWLDLTSDPFYQGKFLGVMKIPAIIFVSLLLTIEIVFDYIRAFTNYDFMHLIVSCYIILHLIVVIFNIVAGYRILKSLSKQSDGKKKLRIIIRRIILSGIVTILGIVVFGLVVSPLVNYPIPATILFFLLFGSFFLQSILLITILKIPKHRETMSSSETNNSSLKDTQDISITKEMDTE